MNCRNIQQLNITCGTDVVLHDKLMFDDEVFDPNVSVDIECSLVNSLGKRTSLEYEIADEVLIIQIPWVDSRNAGCYGLEVNGKCNGKTWATYADSLIRYTRATVEGTSVVEVSSDWYDITQVVTYRYSDSPLDEVEVTIDDNYGVPEVTSTYEHNKLTLDFKNLRGNGIVSVEQTVTSTEDEGVNEATITQDNGNTTVMQVRNGSKGDKGDKGDTGDSAIFDPSTGNISEMKQTTGLDELSPMSQKSVTEALDTYEVQDVKNYTFMNNSVDFKYDKSTHILRCSKAGLYTVRVQIANGYVVNSYATNPRACLGIRCYHLGDSRSFVNGFDYGNGFVPTASTNIEVAVMSQDITVSLNLNADDEIVILDRISGTFTVTITRQSELKNKLDNIRGYTLASSNTYTCKSQTTFNRTSGTLLYTASTAGRYKVVSHLLDGYARKSGYVDTALFFSFRCYDSENHLKLAYDYSANGQQAAPIPQVNLVLSQDMTVYFDLTAGDSIYMLDRIDGACQVDIYKKVDSESSMIDAEKTAVRMEEDDNKNDVINTDFITSSIGSYPNLLKGTQYKVVNGLTNIITADYYGHGAQGHDIYNWFLFKLYDGGYCRIHDISHPQPRFVNHFKLGNNGHCNMCRFSKVFPDGYDFPYLYVAGSDYSNTIYVEKISLTGSELVQTIVIDFDDELNHTVTLGDDGYLYTWKLTSSEGSNRNYTYYKFACPEVESGTVHIDPDSAVATYSYSTTLPTGSIGQGIMVEAGKIFKLHSNINSPQFIDVYDMWADELVKIDLSSIPGVSSVELEDMCVWQNRLYLTAQREIEKYWMLKFD